MDPSISPSFEYLSKVLGMTHQLQQRQVGTFQWNGHHLLALVRYAIKLQSNKNHGRFIDRLRILEESAYQLYKDKSSKRYLKLICTFLKEIVDFFAVPKLQQCSADGNPTSSEIVASFIDFLDEALQVLSVRPGVGIIIPHQINILWKNLKFLLAILGDRPFQLTDLQESMNILAEIESIANEAGSYLYSFFFTKNFVRENEMDQALSILVLNFGILEAKIKELCVRFSDLPSPRTASVSIFIVDSVIDDLNDLIKIKSDLSVDLTDRITRLHEELSSCRSFIQDMEAQKNKELAECVLQLRDLAYEAQYIITWFMFGEIPVWYLAHRLSNFMHKCELIKTSLQQIKLNYGIITSLEVADSHNEVSFQPPKTVPMDEEIVVGLEEKTTEIISQLVGEPKDRLKFISIIGMPGIGKTTLAKKLYSHSSVVLQFDKRAWCVVSHTYRKRKLLIEILSSISQHKVTESEDGLLGERIYKSLKGRRYLIVMDDMWHKDVWDDLERYFPDDRNGSRIVFTSRDKNVAFSDGYLSELSLLSIDQCWDLLQKIVFKNDLCPHELHDVGRKIAKSCKGLPLAVVGIAAILANMEKKEILWQEVATSLSTYISKGQDIFELSYKHLPTHLKPCFLYLGVFEEDVEIPVKKLFPLWISQGFIKEEVDQTLEDTVEECLTELINRSMVQVAKRRCDGGVKTCSVHDLIRDVCLKIANKEHFLKVSKNEFSIHEQHHHLCIHSDSHHLSRDHLVYIFTLCWAISRIPLPLLQA